MEKEKEKYNSTPWHWHDAFGRTEGQGPPRPHPYAVSDAQGFVVANCTGPLVTMSSERSENHARLIAQAPAMHAALHSIINALNANPEPVHYKIREAIDASREVLLATEGEGD